MTVPYHRIAARLYGQPLLVAEDAAMAISGVVLAAMRGGRADAGEQQPDMVEGIYGQRRPDGVVQSGQTRASRFEGAFETITDPETGRATLSPFAITRDGVAIIQINGELVNRGSWIGASSGLVAYEAIQYQLRTAASLERVRAIVLDINSPGGEAAGAFETAEVVREVAAQKPVVAYVNSLAASAGYAIPSGASEIVITPSGHAGSIGVVMMHLDYAEALANEGIKPTLLFEGAHKVDGNPFEPLGDAVRARFQEALSATYEMFLDTVARGRKGRMTKAQARATQAQVYMGQAAVAAGLADRTGTLKSVLTSLSRKTAAARPSGARAATTQGATMTDLNTADPATAATGNIALAAVGTLDTSAIAADARAAGMAEGRAAALADVKAIVESDAAKGKQTLALSLAVEGIAPAKAIAILSNAPVANAPISLAERMAANPVPDVGNAGAAAAGTSDTVRTGWKAAADTINKRNI